MRQIKPLILLAIVIFAAAMWQRYSATPVAGGTPTTSVDGKPAPRETPSSNDTNASVPAGARDVVQLIRRGGPYEHRQDGGVFGNYEGMLPKQPHGYYHEYTVETPGAHNRGARRIITGGTPPDVWYYTDDHYRSFRRFEAPR